jgi:hypothetical protein
MRASVEQAAPFVGRLATALVELTLAAAVIVGAIVVGHDLREWREWYWALPSAFESLQPALEVTEP